MNEVELKNGDTVTIQAGPYRGMAGTVEGITPDPSRKEKSIIIVRVAGGVSVPLWASQVNGPTN